LLSGGHSKPVLRLNQAVDADEKTVKLVHGELGAIYSDEEAWKNGPELVYPGSFDPFHHGHLKIGLAASKIKQKKLIHEISVVNAEKPPLDYLSIQERIQQFGPNIVLTNAPRFLDKAKLFPGATFVVGIDTWKRVTDPRFYENRPKLMRDVIREFQRLQVHFLVFGREIDGKFENLSPADQIEYKGVAESVPESTFRSPKISSSEIRTKGNL
jgi:hypothetical protein